MLFSLLLLALFPVTNENHAMQKKESAEMVISLGSETQNQLRRDGKNHVPKEAVIDRFLTFFYFSVCQNTDATCVLILFTGILPSRQIKFET